MLNLQQIELRERSLKTWGAGLRRKVDVVRTEAEVKSIEPEFREWEAERDLLKRERQNLAGDAMNNSADAAATLETKKVTGGDRNWVPTTKSIPDREWRGLYDAVQRKATGYRVEQKTAEPFGESDFTSGGLPAILMPQLTLSLPYEPDRVFSHFTQLTAPQASQVEYIQHTGNANPAGTVAELVAKPNLGMTLTTVTTSFTKIAALQTFSEEALRDFQTFQTWVPAEMQHAIIDAETNWILNTELPAVSGILTRVIGSDTAVDCVRKGINDLRIGSAFAKANLIVMHPTTWADLQLQKATTGVYLLNPNDPNALGDLNNIFGVNVITNSYATPGDAWIFDTDKSVLAWTRWGLRVEMNGYGGDGTTDFWSQNAIGFRAEERIAIGCRYPAGICHVTGLPSTD